MLIQGEWATDQVEFHLEPKFFDLILQSRASNEFLCMKTVICYLVCISRIALDRVLLSKMIGWRFKAS
jgi:hypothetical protein